MIQIRMTKTKAHQPRLNVVLNFENLHFGIVSGFGFRYSNFQFIHPLHCASKRESYEIVTLCRRLFRGPLERIGTKVPDIFGHFLGIGGKGGAFPG